jgi:hypothetical protein
MHFSAWKSLLYGVIRKRKSLAQTRTKEKFVLNAYTSPIVSSVNAAHLKNISVVG